MHPSNDPKARFTYNDKRYIAAAFVLREQREAYFSNPHNDTEYEAALAAVRAEEDRILTALAVPLASAVPVRFAPRGSA